MDISKEFACINNSATVCHNSRVFDFDEQFEATGEIHMCRNGRGISKRFLLLSVHNISE